MISVDAGGVTVRVLQGDCVAVCAGLEADSFAAAVTDLAAGTAAEHLVCADLLLAGYRAFRADQNCPYDVAVEHGKSLIRVQVKATRKPKVIPNRPGSGVVYQWHARRAGKNGKRNYGADEFDIIALVALDIRSIAYLAERAIVRQCIFLRPPDNQSTHKNRRWRNVDQMPFKIALEALINA